MIKYITKSSFFASLSNIPEGNKVACPGNGYYPISLQYSDYVAENAREESIGQGDPFEKIANRSYKGKGVRTYNKNDMRCYKDADGNTYDFAFGLNWKGVINDSRVKKYK